VKRATLVYLTLSSSSDDILFEFHSSSFQPLKPLKLERASWKSGKERGKTKKFTGKDPNTSKMCSQNLFLGALLPVYLKKKKIGKRCVGGGEERHTVTPTIFDVAK
jgi:hypothetical protein